MKRAKPKPKKNPRRVVLGVGHPWFFKSHQREWDTVQLTNFEIRAGARWDWVCLDFDDLGNYNRIRLVAEVLE